MSTQEDRAAARRSRGNEQSTGRRPRRVMDGRQVSDAGGGERPGDHDRVVPHAWPLLPDLGTAAMPTAVSTVVSASKTSARETR
jgi:hypothetical protein